jgi:hypothetical protein
LESDEILVWEKIQIAESALRERLQVLPKTLSAGGERTEVEVALKYLNLLKGNLTSGGYDVGL